MESKVQKNEKKAPMLQKKTMVSQQKKNQVSVVCISRDYENG